MTLRERRSHALTADVGLQTYDAVISNDTEKLLHEAFMGARHHRHRAIGPEHLLERLIYDGSVRHWLTSKGVDIDRLRESLEARLANVDRFSDDEEVETLPTIEFQKVIQRAIYRVQSEKPKGQVTNLVVLYALLESPNTLATDLGLAGLNPASSKGGTDGVVSRK